MESCFKSGRWKKQKLNIFYKTKSSQKSGLVFLIDTKNISVQFDDKNYLNCVEYKVYYM